jgi:hypothetical protein
MLVETSDANLLRRDYEDMEASLLVPLDDPVGLLQHHTQESLRRFYRAHRTEFASNVMMIALPESDHVDTGRDTVDIDTRVLKNKRVYRLDKRQYIFISEKECDAIMGNMSRMDQVRFQKKYEDCIYTINSQQQQPPKSATVSDVADQSLAKWQELPPQLVSVLQQWKDEHDSVLSHNYELQQENERHRAEKEATELRHRLQLQEVELQYHRQLQQYMSLSTSFNSNTPRLTLPSATSSLYNNNNNTTSLISMSTIQGGGDDCLTNTQPARELSGVTRVSEWIGPNRYGHEQTKWLGRDRMAQHSYQKWDGMFNNPLINNQYLHSLIQVTAGTTTRGHQFRLCVPLTYQYNLRTVLQTLKTGTGYRQRCHWDTLIDACPAEYRVVLSALHPLDETQADLDNTRNCVVLAIHLHFIMVARMIDRTGNLSKGKWRSCCETGMLQQPQARLTPDLSILEDWYPSSLHFGSDTLMTFDLCIRAQYQEGAPKKGSNNNNNTRKKHTTPSLSTPRHTKVASPSKTQRGRASAKRRNSDESDDGDDDDDDDEDDDDDNGDGDEDGYILKKAQPAGEKKKGGVSRSVKGGMGTGNGKTCQFCRSLAIVVKKSGKAQVSHHTNMCPLLAVLSNNEVDILNQLQLACQQGDKKKLSTLLKHKFIFGIEEDQADQDLMKLGERTLPRHATADELATGQHVNGLRINEACLQRLRQSIRQSMRNHLGSDLLFGTMDPVVQQAIGELDGLRELVAANKNTMPPVRKLIFDSDYKGFVSNKFDDCAKKVKHHATTPQSTEAGANTSGIFFAFDTTIVPIPPRITAQIELFQREKENQRQFIATYVESTVATYPPFPPMTDAYGSYIMPSDYGGLSFTTF